jgi:exodeoxyribonuclease VII large subunit
VGHETDFTLCDFAADLRAPTPTASAELATQVTADDLTNYLKDTQGQLSTWISAWLGRAMETVHTKLAQLRLVSPEHTLRSEMQHMDDLARRLSFALIHFLDIKGLKKAGLGERLESLNPEAVLARGYAILTRKADGKVVSRLQHARKEMIARVSDGEFEVIKI